MASSDNQYVPCSRRYRLGQLLANRDLFRGPTTVEVGSSSQVQGKRKRRSSPEKLRADVRRPLPKQPLKLTAPRTCDYCQARLFQYEPPGFCCGSGQIKLPQNQYPPALKRLLKSSDIDAVHFRKHARIYNNLFAFTSLGGSIDAKTVKGIYVFKLHGQIYHNIPDLLPGTAKPKYMQLYFYDAQQEADLRSNCFKNLREDVVKILMEVTALNPYARFFRSLKASEITEETQIRLKKNAVKDQRTMNVPTSDEVAAIWPDSASSSESESPHILVSGKSNESHRIMHFYGCYDPLQYPILNVHGESGWTKGIAKFSKRQGRVTLPASTVPSIQRASTVEQLLEEESLRGNSMEQGKQKNVSCREYYCYKLQSRPGNLMLKAGRCLQQYMVDMYVKVENTRLDFFRHNQKTIRAELYQGIVDSVHTGECIAANVGRRVILPPTFIGGPRDMRKRYLNAMALVRKFGKPELFITMTCNTNWKEIQDELEPGEEAQNRPDLITRIFHSKLIALKKKIVTDKIFGEVAALIYVVEFQKRGLPHAHFLIILKPRWKIRSPADYDRFVSAEFPHKSNNYLRQIVKKHMVHGPCGQLNPLCPCMRRQGSKGKCRSGYPKSFSDVTTSNANGYPLYKRADNGDCETVRGSSLDNRWVIPYNAYLLSLFSCHLNVEICSSIQAVKYLYKYVYKGHDKIGFKVAHTKDVETVDEIKQFQNGRWVSACEAAWRIFSFDLFESHPPVMPLQVHLPDMQTLQIRPHENLERVIDNPKRSRTPLTEYFNMNAQTGGTPWLYGEFPEHYTWDTTEKQWVQRKNKNFSIGRPLPKTSWVPTAKTVVNLK